MCAVSGAGTLPSAHISSSAAGVNADVTITNIGLHEMEVDSEYVRGPESGLIISASPITAVTSPTESAVTSEAAPIASTTVTTVSSSRPPAPSTSAVATEATPILDLTLDYPTDPNLFVDVPLTTSLIRALIHTGPCQPGLKDDYCSFPHDAKSRRFTKNWYEKTLEYNSTKVSRHWLNYSPSVNRVFCFACWLFADKTSPNYMPVWGNPSEGVSKFKKGLEKIEKHERSDIHRNAEKQLLITKYRLVQDKTVLTQQVKAEKLAIQKNREILKRLIDVTLFLAKQNLSFRGHREHSCGGTVKGNEGNFLELVKLMAKYDSILAEHIKYTNRNESYISHQIQNDFIAALAKRVTTVIVDEVKAAKFYSVIIDSTIDIGRVDQLSLSLRYVTSEGNAVERFIMFAELPGASAEEFYKLLLECLQPLGIELRHCRGQAYDGASVMSGNLTGLQTRVKEISPEAMFVHCCAHNLNLCLIDSADCCANSKLFFGTLETLYTFLTSSLPRLKVLEAEQQNELQNTILTLKRLSDTRWASRKRAVESVVSSFPAICKALRRIARGDIKNCTGAALAEANGLLATITTFEFIFLLCFWNKVLHLVFRLSNYLQGSKIDLITATHLINACCLELSELRDEREFTSLERDAMQLAQKAGAETKYACKRIRRVKRFHDERVADESLTDMRDKFKVETFFCLADTFFQQISNRFADFRQHVNKFFVLDPKQFYDDDDVNSGNIAIVKLSEVYKNDVCCTEIVAEYRSFKLVYKDIFPVYKDGLKACEVLAFLIANDMHDVFPNVSTLYKLFMTLPVSSATAERSFSRLKLIKSYLRSTMSESRLTNLALLSI